MYDPKDVPRIQDLSLGRWFSFFFFFLTYRFYRLYLQHPIPPPHALVSF